MNAEESDIVLSPAVAHLVLVRAEINGNKPTLVTEVEIGVVIEYGTMSGVFCQL